MVSLDDITYNNEEEYFRESVGRTLSKPRVWDPDEIYASEKELLGKRLYRQH